MAFSKTPRVWSLVSVMAMTTWGVKRCLCSRGNGEGPALPGAACKGCYEHPRRRREHVGGPSASVPTMAWHKAPHGDFWFLPIARGCYDPPTTAAGGGRQRAFSFSRVVFAQSVGQLLHLKKPVPPWPWWGYPAIIASRWETRLVPHAHLFPALQRVPSGGDIRLQGPCRDFGLYPCRVAWWHTPHPGLGWGQHSLTWCLPPLFLAPTAGDGGWLPARGWHGWFWSISWRCPPTGVRTAALAILSPTPTAILQGQGWSVLWGCPAAAASHCDLGGTRPRGGFTCFSVFPKPLLVF